MRLSHGLVFLPLLIAACQRDASSASSESAIANQNGPSLSAPVSIAGATGPSAFDQVDASAASDGHDFLVAWTETTPSGSQVRAGRIDAKGAVLDDKSIVLTAGEGEDLEPNVAYDGSNYLVAWTHKSGAAEKSIGFIAAARISPDGKVLDADPIKLGLTSAVPAGDRPTYAHAPRVTANGTSWLVVWDDGRTTAAPQTNRSDLFVARIGPDGKPLGDAAGTRITKTGTDEARSLAIASVGDTSLVVWNELHYPGSYELYGLRLGADAAPLDTLPFRFATAFQASYPVVAANSDTFLVGWSEYSSGIGQSGARAQLFGVDGKEVGAIIKDVTAMNEGQPAVAWDGTGWTFASKSGVRRLGADQKVGTVIPITLGRASRGLALATGGGQRLVVSGEHVWSNLYASVGAEPLAATLYAADGTIVRDAIRPARASSSPRDVVSAANGDEALLVWSEYRTDWAHPELRAALRKADGSIGDSFLVRGGEHAILEPSVVFDGSEYVLGWLESDYHITSSVTATMTSHVAGVRITSAGAIEGEPIVSSSADGSIDLAVLNGDAVGLINGQRAFRFPEGIADQSSPLFTVPSEPSFSNSFRSFGSNGKSFVVVWTGMRSGADEVEIHAQHFTASGAKSAVERVATYRHGRPATVGFAGDGDGHTLLVWDDVNDKGGLSGTVFDDKHVIATGALITSPNETGAKVPAAPVVAWDGLQWVVAYEQRPRLGTAEMSTGIALSRVRNTPAGLEVLDSPVVVSAAAAQAPSLSANDKGQAVIAYLADATTTVRGLDDVAGPPLPAAPEPASAGDDDGKAPAPAPPSSKKGGSKSAPVSTPAPSKAAPGSASASESESESAPASNPGSTTITKESGGCSSAPSGSRSNAGAILLAAVALMATRRRKARTPDTRR